MSMKNMNPILSAIIDTTETLNSAPDDYIDPSDGLKYCGKCHTPKEAFYPADLQIRASISTRSCVSALPKSEIAKKLNAGILNA